MFNSSLILEYLSCPILLQRSIHVSLPIDTDRHRHRPNKPKSMLRLRKDRLPDLNPLLLLVRQPSLRLSERPSEDLPNSRRKHLQRQHRLPISHHESDPIGIDGNHPRVHLYILISTSHDLPWGNAGEERGVKLHTLNSASPHNSAMAKSSTALVSCAL